MLKRKADEDAPLIAEPDPILGKINHAFKGTVMVDVRTVTNKWPDVINRDVDQLHVDKLKEIFTAGIHHHLPEN